MTSWLWAPELSARHVRTNSRAAACSVAVVDRDIVGSGATAAGMGHIVVMDDSDAQFALTRYSQQLWQELRPELPDDVEYDQCGTIWVAADEEEMIEVRRKHDYYGKRGVPTRSARRAQPCKVLSPTFARDWPAVFSFRKMVCCIRHVPRVF